jgi:integrase
MRINETLGSSPTRDLASGWLHVGESNTDAGRRRVKLRGALRDELSRLRARRPLASLDGYVFHTSSGGQASADNFHARTLKATVKRANAKLSGHGLPRCPRGSRRTRSDPRSQACFMR